MKFLNKSLVGQPTSHVAKACPVAAKPSPACAAGPSPTGTTGSTPTGMEGSAPRSGRIALQELRFSKSQSSALASINAPGQPESVTRIAECEGCRLALMRTSRPLGKVETMLRVTPLRRAPQTVAKFVGPTVHCGRPLRCVVTTASGAVPASGVPGLITRCSHLHADEGRGPVWAGSNTFAAGGNELNAAHARRIRLADRGGTDRLASRSRWPVSSDACWRCG